MNYESSATIFHSVNITTTNHNQTPLTSQISITITTTKQPSQLQQPAATLRIHPPDVIGKYAPDSVIGTLGGGGGGAVAGGAPAAGGAPGIPMTEVAKHNSKTDCWVVVDGQALGQTWVHGGDIPGSTQRWKDAPQFEDFHLIPR